MVITIYVHFRAVRPRPLSLAALSVRPRRPVSRARRVRMRSHTHNSSMGDTFMHFLKKEFHSLVI